MRRDRTFRMLDIGVHSLQKWLYHKNGELFLIMSVMYSCVCLFVLCLHRANGQYVHMILVLVGER